jgi:hypothetical protein
MHGLIQAKAGDSLATHTAIGYIHAGKPVRGELSISALHDQMKTKMIAAIPNHTRAMSCLAQFLLLKVRFWVGMFLTNAI